MSSVFFEIVVNAIEAQAAGIESRDEIEDPLEEALAESGLAEVTGGGGGSGVYIIDVEVFSEEQVEAALGVIRGVLEKVGAPPTSRFRRGKPV